MIRGFLAALLVVVWAGPAVAGGGPETTLVVVNANDPSSVRVAHAYAAGRSIPRSHLLYLDHVPDRLIIDVESFRTTILKPIEAYLEAEGLSNDIDLVAYSVGFPYAVAFDADAKAKGLPLKAPISRNAALTALTYLYRHVLAEDPRSYLDLGVNRYYRRETARRPSTQRQVTRAQAAKVDDYRGAIRSKDFRRAEKVLDELVADFPDVPGLWYDLACCRALNGKGEEAIEALANAVEHGFVQAEHAERDADLLSVRKHKRFQELLAAMRLKRGAVSTEGARAFSARGAWDRQGKLVDNADSPHRYRMAVMLGWTGAHGNSVDEVLACLERARKSDATFPDGTVYMLMNRDVRSRTRAPMFEAVKAALDGIGRKAEILNATDEGQDGRLPRRRSDAIGVTAGTASFKWGSEDGELLPGSIAEHLTSFGAHFGTASQTKCTEFIRHGAAGTSGAVAEPYALQQKFPTPWIHVHYAKGSSLAEAFYQSVWGPYQLLVLGDGLTQPFARFAKVELRGPGAGTPWSGEVEVGAGIETPPGSTTERIELWVDGRRVAEAKPDESLTWDTRLSSDGVHDVRVVAIEDSPVATRSWTRAWIRTANLDGVVLDPKTTEASVAHGDEIQLRGKIGGLARLEVLQGGRVLHEMDVAKKKTYRIRMPSAPVGLGASEIVLRGITPDGGRILSAPVPIEVTIPTRLRVARVFREGLALPGLRLHAKTESKQVVEGVVSTLGQGRGRTLRQDLESLGAKRVASLRLEGQVRVGEGLAELRVKSAGPVRIRLGGDEVLAAEASDPSGRHLLLLPLAEGWHDLVIEAEGVEATKLEVLLGGSRPTAPLQGNDLAHLPEDRVRAPALEEATVGAGGRATTIVRDGKRGGAKGLDIDSDGVVLRWKKRVKNLVAVVLFPARGKDVPDCGREWIVETRTSPKGKWKPVKGVEIVMAAPLEPPAKEKVHPPRFVEIRFRKTSATELRIRPPKGASPARLAEVEAYVKD